MSLPNDTWFDEHALGRVWNTCVCRIFRRNGILLTSLNDLYFVRMYRLHVVDLCCRYCNDSMRRYIRICRDIGATSVTSDWLILYLKKPLTYTSTDSETVKKWLRERTGVRQWQYFSFRFAYMLYTYFTEAVYVFIFDCQTVTMREVNYAVNYRNYWRAQSSIIIMHGLKFSRHSMVHVRRVNWQTFASVSDLVSVIIIIRQTARSIRPAACLEMVVTTCHQLLVMHCNLTRIPQCHACTWLFSSSCLNLSSAAACIWRQMPISGSTINPH
jgi:hypothetical protein